MNINWKSRLTSKAFWVAIVSTLVLLSQQLGVKIFPDNWADILNTVLSLFTILGIIVDPSTPGISDNIKQPIETNADVQISSDKDIDSTNQNIVQAPMVDKNNVSNVQMVDNSASSKIKVDNPDNIQAIGQEVNHISANMPQ